VTLRRELPDVPGLRRLGAPFWEAFVSALEGVADADGVAALCSHESGFVASATNPKGKATGLIQFMPATARLLGTSTDALREMTEAEQLPYVRAFFVRVGRGRFIERRDVPVAAGWPAYIGRPDSFVAARIGEIAYDWNAPLDLDKDGAITLGELRAKVLGRLARVGRLTWTEEQGRPPSSGWPWLAAGAAGLVAWWLWERQP
jgi:hypothetical protein